MSKVSRFIASVLVALFVTGAPMLVSSASARPNPPAAAQREQPARAPAERSQQDDAQRYAEREKQAQELEEYEGGRAVIIVTSVGTLIIIGLIILLLI